LRGLLIRTLRSRYPKRLKEHLELAGTQPQKFEMRPVWGAAVEAGASGMQFSNSGPTTRRPTSLGFAGQVRCDNVAYENDVCPRAAHQHVEVSTQGS
jgi:hypothetical protein